METHKDGIKIADVHNCQIKNNGKQADIETIPIDFEDFKGNEDDDKPNIDTRILNTPISRYDKGNRENHYPKPSIDSREVIFRNILFRRGPFTNYVRGHSVITWTKWS